MTSEARCPCIRGIRVIGVPAARSPIATTAHSIDIAGGGKNRPLIASRQHAPRDFGIIDDGRERLCEFVRQRGRQFTGDRQASDLREFALMSDTQLGGFAPRVDGQCHRVVLCAHRPLALPKEPEEQRTEDGGAEHAHRQPLIPIWNDIEAQWLRLMPRSAGLTALQFQRETTRW